MKIFFLSGNKAKIAKALGFLGLVATTAAGVVTNEISLATGITTVLFGITSGNIIAEAS